MLIQNWNTVIKPQDKVYHLGDVIMGQRSNYNRILYRLNGHLRLCLGNHDDIKSRELYERFEKIEIWRIFKDHGFVCSHIPIVKEQFRHKVVLNLHGHLHNPIVLDEKGKPDLHYKNVCVEHTALKPIHLDEIKQIIKDRGLK